MACVNLPEFPLQLLLREHPEWQKLPAAVVDRDKAQGVILWANECARAHRILPGTRYAAGLSLSSHLRAGVVSETHIAKAVAELSERLRFFTPDVEPSEHEPGVFWLDASGLSLLYPSLRKWAAMIRADLTQAGFACAVVVGFSRFGTYAVARSLAPTGAGHHTDAIHHNGAGTVVFDTRDTERAQASEVKIERLGLEPSFRDVLTKLGVTTLGAFLKLPSNGIRKRFGADVHRLYQLAKGELWAPLQPTVPIEPVVATIDYEHPETSLDRLIAVIEQELQKLLPRLAKQNQALVATTLRFLLDNGESQTERLQTAGPTLDLPQVIDLVRLRLQQTSLAGGVATVTLEVERVATTTRQGDLFATKPRRDPAATDRAFARLRAELGESAVVSARLRDGHLPEARFRWEPMHHIASPQPRNVRYPPLVRRIFTKPVVVSHGRPRRPDEQLRAFIDDGVIAEPLGPYIVSGGWWVREVEREYYYVQTRQGRSLWIYYDRRRKRWLMHGAVE